MGKDIAASFNSEVRNLCSVANDFASTYSKKHGTLVYNPLDYAGNVMEDYIRRYLKASAKVILLGMNPGPFGMTQTGVPFGDIKMVRDWMNIELPVQKPKREHPKRPVTGFACTRSEVSGTRLWGWAKDRYMLPETFFKNYFVWNYCPLVFMEEGGANRTPDKIEKDEQKILFSLCDETLRSLVQILNPDFVIGVGKFAMKRAENAVGDIVSTDDILHPSPASPKANKDWKGEVERKLESISCLF